MHMTPDGNIRLPLPTEAVRRIKKGVKQHFTGSLVAGEDEGREVETESHAEMITALVMLARRNVVGLENQVPFSWTDRDGIARTHFFDFRVSLRDGSRLGLIVKNARKAAQPGFCTDMRFLARQASPDFADRIALVTSKHFDPVEVHNAELIHSVRLPDPEPDAAVRRVVAGITGAARVCDIVVAAGCLGSGFRSVVRLIRNHELELVTHERIDHETLVRRRVA